MKMNRELIVSYLDSLFEDPKCELNYTKDYELVLSVMLSAQTTDKGVNRDIDMYLYTIYIYIYIIDPIWQLG